jgi:hypothetical protein
MSIFPTLPETSWPYQRIIALIIFVVFVAFIYCWWIARPYYVSFLSTEVETTELLPPGDQTWLAGKMNDLVGWLSQNYPSAFKLCPHCHVEGMADIFTARCLSARRCASLCDAGMI